MVDSVAVESDFEPPLEDYRDNPAFYELEERSRPDEMAMIYGAAEKALEITRRRGHGSIIDLCSGTGLSHEKLVDDPSVERIYGVDISKPYVAFAKERFKTTRVTPTYILGDVVTAPIPAFAWDIVMMCSAYHHIEDERKVQFLKRVRSLMGSQGFGVMAENILPEYDIERRESYAESVRVFYSSVLETAKNDNPDLPDVVSRLIRRVAQYGYDGDYEYKVSHPIFRRHLKEAGLKVVSEDRVWPPAGDNSLGSGGNYVVVIQAS